MSNFAGFISPERAKALGDTRSLEELRQLAKTNGTCSNCGEPIWRYAGNGLCFSCTTGEEDASEDYEIGEWYE
jgi:uncharacterized Zn finger protein (UPF0148 family)